MMNRIGLALLAFFALAGIANATCSGVCVQESTVAVGTSGAAPNPALGGNTTAGDALIAIESTTSGNTAQSVSGQGATWVTLADSGNSTSSGVRTKVFCGVVVTPGTTITFAGNGSSAGYLLETNKKGCNLSSVSGAATVGFAASGTTIASYSTGTLSSGPVVIATAAVRTAQAITLTQSLTATNTTSSAPGFAGAYGQNSGTNTFSASFGSTDQNAWTAVAFNDQCTNNDACVQQSTATRTGSGAANTNTLARSATVNNTICALELGGNGTAGVTISAPSGTDFSVDAWRLLADSGAATSTGRRVYIYCGIVTHAGTTFVSTLGASTGLVVSAVEIHGYLPVVDVKAVANSGASTVTSLSTGNITTLNANDFILAGTSIGGTATALTDTSTGFRLLASRNTQGPEFMGDYLVQGSTTTTAASWSWTTADTAAAAIVALAQGTPKTVVDDDIDSASD